MTDNTKNERTKKNKDTRKYLKIRKWKQFYTKLLKKRKFLYTF